MLNGNVFQITYSLLKNIKVPKVPQPVEISVLKRIMLLFQIYDEPLKSGVFQEIKSYKPSSLVSIEFGQGETLLAFLEDNKVLQVYEYKGEIIIYFMLFIPGIRKACGCVKPIRVFWSSARKPILTLRNKNVCAKVSCVSNHLF